MKRYINISALLAAVALLVFTAAGSIKANSAMAAPMVQTTTVKPVAKSKSQKLVCRQGSITVVANGADKVVKATGGCTYAGKSVGVWSWTRSAITDAAGTTCSIPSSPPMSGKGSSITVVPAGRLTPTFTLVVKKTKKYPARVLHVGGKPVIAGWDSCGTPLPVSSLPADDPSSLCKYTGVGSFDVASRTLQLSGVACPASFGACHWQLDTSYYWHGIALGVMDYQGIIACDHGEFALPVALLNGGCLRVDGLGAFVVPPGMGGGNIYWDVTVVTEGSDRQPISANVVSPGDPHWNGYTAYQRIGPYQLPGSKPICG